MPPASLATTLELLQDIAPLAAAAAWDNCGLILEPARPRAVEKILLAIDLTPAVAEEALRKKCDLIVAYHPPIFAGLKTLRASDPSVAPLLRLLEAGVAAYSPHTALDAAAGGVADWIGGAFAASAVERLDEHGVVAAGGAGRLLHLRAALTLAALGQTLARHLDLPYLRVARAATGPARIRRFAFCAGAGASVLRGALADAVFSGEMRHHDVLDLNRRGVHVLLSEHSHSERPYLAVLAKRLRQGLPAGTRVDISRADRDPIRFLLPTPSKERP
jgi:dinuclear metal center YbgI/SA1388 family protein